MDGRPKAMAHAFETMGNATCLVTEDGAPILVTDPWLLGTAYFGSWAHYHPPSHAQRLNCLAAPFVFFSHGHPDHLHPQSVSLLSRETTILLGDHYHAGLYHDFIAQGFRDVRVLKDKVWTRLSPGIRVLAISNMNQDTILLIEAGDALIVDLNDSPLMGERAYLRRIIRAYNSSYLLALCTNNADMINIVDENRNVILGPEERKKGTVMAMSERCKSLGVQNFCCFSSQHLYVRSDSAWANDYHITWSDMQRHWPSAAVRLIEPYVTISLDSGTIARNHPAQTPDLSLMTTGTGEDDWSERLSPKERTEVELYILKYQTLRSKMDFVEFVVGGESLRIAVSPRKLRRRGKDRGIIFFAPRRSLMETVRGGYFDDLLIGNFMPARFINMGLYPHFGPRVTKWGDNAKAYSTTEVLAFRWHYFRRSPSAAIRDMGGSFWQHNVLPRLKSALSQLGLFHLAKALYRRATSRG